MEADQAQFGSSSLSEFFLFWRPWAVSPSTQMNQVNGSAGISLVSSDSATERSQFDCNQGYISIVFEISAVSLKDIHGSMSVPQSINSAPLTAVPPDVGSSRTAAREG